MTYPLRALLLLAAAWLLPAAPGGELRFCIRSEPNTLDPLLVTGESAETVRYLTGGVLIRLNRRTQEAVPELARAWQVSDQGRTIRFELRRGVRFSDGAPFTAEDVAFTVRRMMDPKLVSPVGDSFRSGAGPVQAEVVAPDVVRLRFPAPLAGMERLFDQLSIQSARAADPAQAVLGPFYVAERKPGVSLLLRRNPHYWKTDAKGVRLPYLDAIRLDIQQNREVELLRFQRGEIHLINSLDPELFDRLEKTSPGAAVDAGPTQDAEMFWFNQAPAAPIPEYKKAWFASRNFRRAVSEAIRRDDISRLAFRGHARPAAAPFSEANRFWRHPGLKPHAADRESILRRLAQDGFRREGETLKDSGGRPVEFSLITNSGNKVRAQIAALIEQDLAGIGMRVRLVSLDFPSLIERISRTADYEACLLGLVNVDLDPNAQMNVWLSSGANHQWNPGQKTPATPWEAEIDRAMQAQASTLDPARRKAHFDRVQEIVWEEAPIVYLVHRHALLALSPRLQNAAPSPFRPQAYWNIEFLYLDRP